MTTLRLAVLVSVVAFGLVAIACSGDDASCGDTQIDPANCGACGHSCFGAACASGVCSRVAISRASPVRRSIAKDDVAVWFDPTDGGSIHMARLDSWVRAARPEDKPHPGEGVTGIATAGGFVYWSQGDGIHRCSALGCDPLRANAPIVPLDAYVDAGTPRDPDAEVFDSGVPAPKPPSQVVPIAAGGDLILFVLGGGEILRCPATGCATGTSVYRAASSEGTITAVETDGHFITFLEGGALRGCAIDDCQSSAKTIAPKLGSGDVLFGQYGARVAWVSAEQVFVCSLPACVETKLFPAPQANGVSLDERFVYVTRFDDEKLRRCALEGCAEDAGVVDAAGKAAYVKATTHFVTFNDFAAGTIMRLPQ